MAARDRYKVDVMCPACGNTGVLHLSEDDHPYMRKLHREADAITGSFTASMLNDADVQITCNECSHSFTR